MDKLNLKSFKQRALEVTVGRRVQMLLAFGVFTATVVVFQNCGQPVQFNDALESLDHSGLGEPIVTTPSQSLGVFSSEQFVCEPFGHSSGSTSQNSGLKGRLKYLDRGFYSSSGEANGVTIAKYYHSGTPGIISPIQDLYFSQINVPTRPFESGFQTNNGNSILDSQGAVLTEYFSIEYNTLLRLGVSDAAGTYRLGIVSDDGSVVEAKIDGVWKKIVDNDGTHSTRMECAGSLLYLDKQSQVPLRVRYYQGPRTQIANVLVWRYEAAGNITPEIQCGQSGSGIESRGWQVIGAENFILPDEEVNPCLSSVNMDVKDLKLSEDSDRNIIFSFESSHAAQVGFEVKNQMGNLFASGQETGETRSHVLMLGPIPVDQQYEVSVTLKSAALGVSIKRSFVLKPVAK